MCNLNPSYLYIGICEQRQMELLLDDIICYMMFWSLILVEAIPKLFYMVNEMMKFIKYEQI